jgi:hypothetical protein
VGKGSIILSAAAILASALPAAAQYGAPMGVPYYTTPQTIGGALGAAAANNAAQPPDCVRMPEGRGYRTVCTQNRTPDPARR